MPNFTVLNPQVEALDIVPDEVKIEFAVVKYKNALSAFEQNDLQAARVIFEELILQLQDYDLKDVPESARLVILRYLIHKNLSSLLWKCGEIPPAIEQAELALSFKKTDPSLWFSLGKLLYSDKRFSDAVRAFYKSLSLFPGRLIRLKCLHGVCECLFNIGLFEKCLDYLKSAMILEPSYDRGLYIKSQIEDEYQKTLCFLLSLGLNPSDVLVAFNNAKILAESQDLSKATNKLCQNFPISINNPREVVVPNTPKISVVTKELELDSMSFYNLGKLLLNEFCESFNEVDAIIISNIRVVRNGNSEVHENNIPLNSNGRDDVLMDKDTKLNEASTKRSSCEDIQETQVNKKRKTPSNYGSRRSSKRLEKKSTRDSYSNYKYVNSYDNTFTGFIDLELDFESKLNIFFLEYANLESLADNIFSNTYTSETIKVSKPVTYNLNNHEYPESECRIRPDDDEIFLCEFLKVAELQSDILDLTRNYIKFYVCAASKPSLLGNKSFIFSKPVRDLIILLIKEIEKRDLGISFWKAQYDIYTEVESKVEIVRSILYIGEILFDYLISNPQCTCDLQISSLEGKTTKIVPCEYPCKLCIFYRITSTLKLLKIEIELDRSTHARIDWLLLKFANIYGSARMIYDINQVSSLYQRLLSSLESADGPIVTLSKVEGKISVQLLTDKIFSINTMKFCIDLIDKKSELPREFLKNFVDIYLVKMDANHENGDELQNNCVSCQNIDSKNLISEKFRISLEEGIDLERKDELFDILNETSTIIYGRSGNFRSLVILLWRAINTLLKGHDLTRALVKCVKIINEILEFLAEKKWSDFEWANILDSYYGISKELKLSHNLLDLFLSSCYICGNLSWILIKNSENFHNAEKKAQNPNFKMIEEFCVSSLCLLIHFVSYCYINLPDEKSESSSESENPEQRLLLFVILAHYHLSTGNMCTSSEGGFLINEVRLLKSLTDTEIKDELNLELNQCYRCLYNFYLKNIPTEDHQTTSFPLTEDVALDLFSEIKTRIEDKSTYINKTMIQDYISLLTRIGDKLGDKIYKTRGNVYKSDYKSDILNPGLMLYNEGYLNRYLNKPLDFNSEEILFIVSNNRLTNIRFKLHPVDFSGYANEKLKGFCENFYYILGEASRNLCVQKKGAIQSANSDKIIASLEFSIKQFKKSICINSEDWKLWRHLGECYHSLVTEYLSRRATYIIANFRVIHEYRMHAFQCYAMAINLLQYLCQKSNNDFRTELGNLWGALGTLCYEIYFLPTDNISDKNREDKLKYEVTKLWDLRLLDHELNPRIYNHSQLFSDANEKCMDVEFLSDQGDSGIFLCERTSAITDLINHGYNSYMNFLVSKYNDSSYEISDSVLQNQVLEMCFPFVRSRNALKIAAFSIDKALELLSNDKELWIYYMILGNVYCYLEYPPEIISENYLNSISASCAERTAKDADVILNNYIKASAFLCNYFVRKLITPEYVIITVNRILEAGDKNLGEKFEIDEHREPNEDDAMNALYHIITIIGNADKKGLYHEHIYFKSFLHYFVKNDKEKANERFKSLSKLQGGKLNGFPSLWRSEFGYPGEIYIFTHKYILFSLSLSKETGDIKYLRKLIKKLPRSKDRLLWPKLIFERALRVSAEYIMNVLQENFPNNEPSSQIIDFTVLDVSPIVIHFVVIKVLGQELSILLNTLYLASEVLENLPKNECIQALIPKVYFNFVKRFEECILKDEEAFFSKINEFLDSNKLPEDLSSSRLLSDCRNILNAFKESNQSQEQSDPDNTSKKSFLFLKFMNTSTKQ